MRLFHCLRRGALIAVAAATFHLQCPVAPLAASLLPDDLAGVRTKWAFVAGDKSAANRRSAEPDTFGLEPGKWLAMLERAGVNVAELNIDPATSNDGEAGAGAASADDMVRHSSYTRGKRDEVLLDFLGRLEAARRSGEVKGDIGFILHQRLWFRPGAGQNRARKREARTLSFATDMATFINKARARHLDHWIAGVRLGENSDNDMEEYLPILVGIAKELNAQTDNWLKSHLFVANGGGMGAEYAGIANLGDSFFPAISAQTGSFTFAYKWMVRRGDERWISRAMGDADCGSQRLCNPESVADWKTFLSQLGLNDLVTLIRSNHRRFPRHANVVFAGDSSDSVALMTKADNGSLDWKPQLTALDQLWPRDLGWRGRIFMDAFVDDQTMPRIGREGTPDIGVSLFYVPHPGEAVPQPNSTRFWQSWPSETGQKSQATP